MQYAEFPILSLIIFSPVLGIALAGVFRDASDGIPAKVAALSSSLLTFLLSLYLWFHFDASEEGLQLVERTGWIPQFNIEYFLGLDGLNLFFLLIITFITPLALLGSWNLQKRNWQFQIQMLLLEIGMLGCFAAFDVVLFYVFFEVMLVPMYFLIGIWGGSNRLYATMKFVIYTMVGSLLMLVALIYTAILFKEINNGWSFNILDWYGMNIAPETQTWLFLGFAVAFAVKIPLFPFHTWLPDAHYEAPTAGSVQLAAVMLKFGPYGFLRFAMPVFPAAVYELTPLFITLSLIGIIYGGLVAMVQKQIKRLIAYSSVAHMGYIVLGLFALNTQGVYGGWIQMINHAIVTGALFLVVGMIYERTHTQEIVDYGGVIHTMPLFSVFLVFFSMASVGLPGLNGFVGEVLAMVGAARVNIWYGIIAAAGVIIAAIYMLWMVQRVLFGPLVKDMVKGLNDLSLREVVVLVPLAFWTVFLGVYPQPFFDSIDVSVQKYIEQIKSQEPRFAQDENKQKDLLSLMGLKKPELLSKR
ncbi:MAG: NADH-quinone oxidoreductase subunit M [SAR324 cluster bacterium]|nr:NADH-quinone oxidoreductase subunit M [SAR324 cluster bacterium]